ncbi:MAG: proteasome accessory factor PafA2 family protein, partial [Limisphaerales bacterium]
SIAEPPRTTRAYIRGRCIQKFSQYVVSAQWDHVTLQGSSGPLKISLLNVFTPEELAVFALVVDAAKTPDDLQKIAEPAVV